MKRIAIVIDKNLESGKVANACSVLMGQGALFNSGLYSNSKLKGVDNVVHASIQYNIIILKGGAGQLLNLIFDAKKLLVEDESCIVFTKTGQGLHNSFEEYQKIIEESSVSDNSPVAVLLIGEDEIVRSLTKKFSLYV